MTRRPVALPADVPIQLTMGLTDLLAELDVSDDFDGPTLECATRDADDPRLPSVDRSDLELVTIDPPGAKDLDQALFIERFHAGFCVWYAIADVAAFVRPGDAVDAEAHHRGQTFYAPHRRFPLHPPVLSEGAASLLADQLRQALLWRMELDATGECTAAEVSRAMVRSRAQLTYQQVTEQLEQGNASESLQLLQVVGELRQEVEQRRGGVSLNLPQQEVEVSDGTWTLSHRVPLPAEDWNAQISLLTGISAATLMVQHKVGILRTLPPADEKSVTRLRTTAAALHLDWPASMSYPDFVRSLDPATPRGAAMEYACLTLFRGAGYQSFHGTLPEQTQHAALASVYAHATAPLRRLVDRYVGEICVALCAGNPVPQWVLDDLDELPDIMNGSDRRAKHFDRGVVDLTEALVLSGREGQVFTGTVVDADPEHGRARFVIADPAVETVVTGTDLPLGEEVQARLESVDLSTGATTFARVNG